MKPHNKLNVENLKKKKKMKEKPAIGVLQTTLTHAKQTKQVINSN